MKKYIKIIGQVIFVLIISTGAILAQKHPFPQNLKYSEGSIKPSNYTATQLNSHTVLFYLDWQKRFLQNNECGADQYFVRYTPSGDITVSEAHGYGMMILVYVAGVDVLAKEKFDGMYNYYINHLAQTERYPNSKLLSWKQTKGCVTREKDLGTATDGDIDVAFALLLAHYQWGSDGINYLQAAIEMIDDIMLEEIHPKYNTILLGDWVDLEGKFGNGTRTSDFILDHFRSFENVTGEKRWHAVLEKCYAIIAHLQKHSSPKTGLLPDFVENANTDNPTPPTGMYLENSIGDGNYFYNACRDPWRIAVDYLINNDIRAKESCDKINVWIRKTTSNRPVEIKSGYKLNGNNISGNDYLSSAYVAPFVVGAMVDASHQKWLDKSYEMLIGLKGEEYYESTIKMLSLLVLSGNYWAPESYPEELNKNAKQRLIIFSITQKSIEQNRMMSIVMQGAEKGDFVLEIIDVNDKLIFTLDLSMNENAHYNLNVNTLPEGEYIVKFLAEDFEKTYPIIIPEVKE